MNNLLPAFVGDFNRVEYGGEPVLNTTQLAAAYETTPDNLRQNFKRNIERFIEGKHFYKLTGNDLKSFMTNCHEATSKFSPILYLWTKRGAARHAKMLSTDKAWEVFEALEDNYFTTRHIDTTPGAPFDFERGVALAKLVPHTKDAMTKHRLIAKAANLILGEDFIPVPPDKHDIEISLFYHKGR